MCRTVGPCEATPVETERDGQVLQCHFLEDVIEAALQERAVNVDDRPESAFCHSSRECDRMSFANPRVEEPVGKFLPDSTEFVSFAHRRRQHANFRIALHRVVNRITHRIGVGSRIRFAD